MFKYLALISVLTSAAWAQSATNATSSSTSSSQNPLIPQGISSPCTSYLNLLNTNSTLNTCLTTLTNATSAFAPGSTAAPSSAAVATALTSFCNDTITTACPESLIREQLTKFYAACPTELTTNSNSDIIRIYDVLYALLPLRTSVCAKDDSANSCSRGPPSMSTRELDETSDAMSPINPRDDSAALRSQDVLTAIVPNMTMYRDTNLLFAFFTPNLSAAQLCVSCTRQILTAYISFESDMPYAPGMDKSQVLSTQSALFSAVQSKCPANFLNNAVQAAGGLSSNGISSSAVSTYGADYQHIIALVMGAVTLVVSVAL